MKEYRVEQHNVDHYKNGVCVFKQNAEPMRVTAVAHIHESIEILYIVAGGYTITLDDMEYKVFEGDLILARSGVIHHTVADASPEHAYYVVKIRPDFLRDLASPQMENTYALALSLSRPGLKCCWRKDELPAETLAGLQALIDEFGKDTPYADVAIKLAAGAVLLGLLRTDIQETGMLSGKGRETDRIVYEAMAYIRRNYGEELSVESIAKQFNISYSYFSRLFKEVTGRSFKAYTNFVRINHAERMLYSGNQSIGEIAQACGYNDVSYFIKVFRQMKGCSPKAYRKTYK